MSAAVANPTIALKAAGRRRRTTLRELGNASVHPAELETLNARTCFHPDFADRELAESDPDDVQRAFDGVYDAATCDAIQSMHQRMLEATGRGSWPAGCHAEYPHQDYHAALIYIDVAGFLRNASLHREVSDEEWQQVVVDARVWPSVDNPVASVADCRRLFSYDSQDPRVRVFDRPQWAERSDRQAGQPYTVFDMSSWLYFEAARRAGCFLFEVFTGEAGKHNIHEKMIAIPGSTAGYAYFNNATCGDHVTSNIDSLNTSYDLGWAAGLRCHENGHTLNLQHEFGGVQSSHRSIMSYAQDNRPFQGYRRTGAPYQYTEDQSWPELRQLFGGEAAKPIEVVIPLPDLPPSIPGILAGRRLTDGTYAVEGVIGPIPGGAVGKRYIVQRLGETPQHQLIPQADV